MIMAKAYILGACRTAVGKFGGSLKDTPPQEMGAICIKGGAAPGQRKTGAGR